LVSIYGLRTDKWNIKFDALFWREERWNIKFVALFWQEERWNIKFDAISWISHPAHTSHKYPIIASQLTTIMAGGRRSDAPPLPIADCRLPIADCRLPKQDAAADGDAAADEPSDGQMREKTQNQISIRRARYWIPDLLRDDFHRHRLRSTGTFRQIQKHSSPKLP
jgi:hypothetical protein